MRAILVSRAIRGCRILARALPATWNSTDLAAELGRHEGRFDETRSVRFCPAAGESDRPRRFSAGSIGVRAD